jgi:hypothetical protein
VLAGALSATLSLSWPVSWRDSIGWGGVVSLALAVLHRVLESADGLAEIRADGAQLLGAEDHQHDHQHDQQMLRRE